MVWNILNNVDLESAKNEPLDKRVPFLELSGIIEVKISFNNNKHFIINYLYSFIPSWLLYQLHIYDLKIFWYSRTE